MPPRFRGTASPLQSGRIVPHALATLTLHRHPIFFLVHSLHPPVFSGTDSERLAASRITHNVAHGVLPRTIVDPLPSSLASPPALRISLRARRCGRPAAMP